MNKYIIAIGILLLPVSLLKAQVSSAYQVAFTNASGAAVPLTSFRRQKSDHSSVQCGNP